jgi:hypothetical protein
LGDVEKVPDTPPGAIDALELAVEELGAEDLGESLPTSTAPPRLETSKRKRASTIKAQEWQKQLQQSKKGRKGAVQGKN